MVMRSIVSSLFLTTLIISPVAASVPSGEPLLGTQAPVKKKVQYFEELIKTQEPNTPSRKSAEELLQELTTNVERHVKGFRGTLEDFSKLTSETKGISSLNLTTDLQKYQELKTARVDPLFKTIREQFTTFKETQTALFEELAKLLPQTLQDPERLKTALNELEARKKVLTSYIADFEKGLNSEYIKLTVELSKSHLGPEAAAEQIKHLVFLSDTWLQELDKISQYAVKSQWSKEEPKVPSKSKNLTPTVDITTGFAKDVAEAKKLEAVQHKKDKERSNSLTNMKQAVRAKIKSMSVSSKKEELKIEERKK